eukprot:365596-Chlamydomonas_euryale.AAC.40
MQQPGIAKSVEAASVLATRRGIADLLTCPPSHLPPAHRPAILHASQSACLPACQPASMHACTHASMCAHTRAHMLATKQARSSYAACWASRIVRAVHQLHSMQC